MVGCRSLGTLRVFNLLERKAATFSFLFAFKSVSHTAAGVFLMKIPVHRYLLQTMYFTFMVSRFGHVKYQTERIRFRARRLRNAGICAFPGIPFLSFPSNQFFHIGQLVV